MIGNTSSTGLGAKDPNFGFLPFLWRDIGGRSCLVPRSSEERFGRIVAGFGGKEFFRKGDVSKLLRASKCSRFLSLEQVHGREIVILEDSEQVLSHSSSLSSECWPVAADGWFLNREAFSGSGFLFGISTADCLPVLLVGDSFVALLHAGWQGLHGGMLESGVKLFQKNKDIVREVWVGPAADPAHYEVGSEFRGMMSEDSLTPTENDRFLFNMYSEAELRLQGVGVESPVYFSPVYTMTDDRYCSYRKDSASPARNLSFIAFPAHERR